MEYIQPDRHIARRHSSSFTLASLFMVLLLLSIATLMYFMRLASDDNQRHEVEATIRSDVRGLLDVYNTSDVERMAEVIQYRLKQSHDGSIYIVADMHRNVIMGNFAYMPENASEAIFEFELPRDTQATGLPEGKRYKIIALMAQLNNGYYLVVGRNIPEMNTQSTFIGSLGIAMIVILALLAAAGFFISDRVVYRINQIAQTASDIMRTGDLSQRIPVHNNWDDLSVLANLLNQLLERVEHSMQAVRQVSDNVAHDLRTPLTRLKNGLASLQERMPADAGQEADALIQEADHLLATFSALLRIGNLESGSWRNTHEAVACDAVLRDVIEFYEPLAQEKNQQMHVTISDNITVLGDRNLLFQAFVNVMDNAVKYAPDAGTISVILTQDEAQMICRISNTGAGVKEADLEKIFQRFYRADPSRASHGGNGLGLSMVKAVIIAHRGSVRAYHDADTGFTIEMLLPLG